jgi:hypothetical protein
MAEGGERREGGKRKVEGFFKAFYIPQGRKQKTSSTRKRKRIHGILISET